ncbi:MAG: hypothetical protein A2452_01560 [Candidatus Firestonebacteria bacterium RIFOXYC2_FULL_39_67]|nr:MAG: hypothetical protein A2536_05775 [Candidatus Firestonebacteria bacterium RIFOXYD2_FULL_39_29]OGF54199.1 MAG: hypothetical protein A2452_01560 [Candidatus Firestonebacteria bacterium RIFOXYC2_FULL_39_67]OGF57675.1 MAG: hypothetical protein A2497_03500 [Candidatus Firestonebacteria bacterium RifOxyC12_full_39_7]
MTLKYTSLSDNSIRDIEDIIAYKGRIVSAKDIKNALKSKYKDSTIRKKIYLLKAKGWLISFKKGVYYVSDISSRGFTGLSPYVISGALIEDSYVTAESALSYYGYIEQMHRTVTSAVKVKSREFEFQDKYYSFIKIAQDLFFGYQVVMIDGHKARIAELEKSILDFLYLKHNLQSIETILEVLSKVQKRLDIKKITEYSKIFPETTRRLLGFLLELEGFDTVELNKTVSKKGVSRMSAVSNIFNAKWRLYYEDGINGQGKA